jgi:hypothetical protein
LIDLTPTDVSGPISSFQATRATNKASVFKMLKEINGRCERKLDENILEQIFEREWPEFEAKLNEVIELEKAGGAVRPPKRDDSEILAEILGRVRAIEREALDQRFQIDLVAGELMGVGVSHADLRSREVFLRSRDAERKGLRQAELEAEEAASRLVGRIVQVATFEEGPIRGEVVSTLTRGTGVYVRVTDENDSTHTFPLASIKEVESEK